MRTIAVLLVFGCVLGVCIAAADDPAPYRQPAISVCYGFGELAVGDWALAFVGPWRPVAAEGVVTGMAFGPGRRELVFCTADEALGSAVWVSAIPEMSHRSFRGPEAEVHSPVSSRLLWRAPEGAALSGPIWWSPNAARFALLARTGDAVDLISLDALSGAPTVLVRGAAIADLAWHPSRPLLAYAAASGEGREVWVQAIPPSDPQRVGEGGHHLRWALDGTLSWLLAESGVSWTEWSWRPSAGPAEQTDIVPARPDGALWSPDGAACAALATAERDPGLAIHPAASQVPDLIPLPHADAEEVLCWSPDSRIVLLRTHDNHLLAASARPPGSNVVDTAVSRGHRPDAPAVVARATLLHYPMIDPRAGAPAWSSDSGYLAYVVAGAAETLSAYPWFSPQDHPLGQLIVQQVGRAYVESPGRLTASAVEAAKVLHNMKNVCLALQMYLADNGDRFPLDSDMEGAMSTLDDYVHTREVFLVPGTENEVAFRYLMPPGISLVAIQNPAGTPAFIADYHSDFVTIGFADGHSINLDRTPENEAKLEKWWAEFERLLDEGPDALPPPFR